MTKYFPEDMINKIIDEQFMDKDVSELVKGDYYLFLVFNDVVYMYRDGIVLGCNEESIVYRAEYKSGTLKELATKLEFGL